jgi:sigma-B regulation protein RsbU (phosphoserine phosphatase)
MPDGTQHEVPASGPPLGLTEDIEYPSTVLAFPPGARMLVFTDGLTDPRDGRGAFASHNDLADWLVEHAGQSVSASGLHHALLQRLRLHSTTAPLADDQTFLVVHRHDAPAGTSAA